jgi:alginate O-acetyltransferase complex protein AlgI
VDIRAAHSQTLRVARLVGLFAIAWLLPNTQQLMARFSPTISKFDPGSDRVWRWQPTVAWGVAVALLLIATLAGRLGDLARFLYFQF